MINVTGEVPPHVRSGSFSREPAGPACHFESDLIVVRTRDDAKGQSTKSLRSSPRRGSKSRRAGRRLTPNKLHHLFLADYIALYPNARIYAAPGLYEMTGRQRYRAWSIL
jgi:hypothetical protein